MSDVNAYRLDVVEKDVSEIKQAIKSIDTSLQVLARLEERHQETREGLNRAFVMLDDHEKRIRGIESEAPTTKLVKTWVFSAVTAVLSVVLTIIGAQILGK